MNPERPLVTLQVVCMALMVSVFVYGFCLFMVAEPGLAESDPLIPMAMMFAAVSVAVVSFVLRRMLLGSLALGRSHENELLRGMPASQEVLEQELMSIQQRLFPGIIAPFALCESVAIFGFIAGYLEGNASLYVPYGVASLVLMAIHFPREQTVTALLTPEARAARRG